MGSLFKRGKHWYICYDLPPGPDGKRRQKMQSCRGLSESQAKARLRKIETGIDENTYIDPSTATLAEYLGQWLQHCDSRLAASTVVGYRGVVDRYIVPDLGRIQLRKLEPIHIQQFLDALGKPKKQGGRELSPKTIYNAYGALRKALKHACRLDMIPRNPCDRLDPPKLRLRQMPTATDTELVALLTAIEKSTYRIPILISLTTGLRRGEVIGLKWEDFDAGKRQLQIWRSMAQVPGQKPFPKEPKSGKSRTVDLCDYVAEELIAHRKTQIACRMNDADSCPPDDGWICTYDNGTHITPNALTKGFIRLRDSVGARISFHGLRHTVATELLMSGIPLKTVSEILGHANSSVTQDVYGHVSTQSRAAAVNVIGEMLKRARGSS